MLITLGDFVFGWDDPGEPAVVIAGFGFGWSIEELAPKLIMIPPSSSSSSEPSSDDDLSSSVSSKRNVQD